MTGPTVVVMRPIGFVRTEARDIPRHWSVSDVKGRLEMDPAYAEALSDIRPGDRIVVLFHFDRSPAFEPSRHLRQTPPHRKGPLGVFSICSPVRPNPIGLSVLEVLDTQGPVIHVKGIDMLDATPILDIKPFITGKEDCPSYSGSA
ncbi:MAG: tRNA (N6-threonylcarbamoyladenosine(37)-N6)-methyltransferase TrmO [Thermodesulfobacteriota bacterium]